MFKISMDKLSILEDWIEEAENEILKDFLSVSEIESRKQKIDYNNHYSEHSDNSNFVSYSTSLDNVVKIYRTDLSCYHIYSETILFSNDLESDGSLFFYPESSILKSKKNDFSYLKHQNSNFNRKFSSFFRRRPKNSGPENINIIWRGFKGKIDLGLIKKCHEKKFTESLFSNIANSDDNGNKKTFRFYSAESDKVHSNQLYIAELSEDEIVSKDQIRIIESNLEKTRLEAIEQTLQNLLKSKEKLDNFKSKAKNIEIYCNLTDYNKKIINNIKEIVEKKLEIEFKIINQISTELSLSSENSDENSGNNSLYTANESEITNSRSSNNQSNNSNNLNIDETNSDRSQFSHSSEINLQKNLLIKFFHQNNLSPQELILYSIIANSNETVNFENFSNSLKSILDLNHREKFLSDDSFQFKRYYLRNSYDFILDNQDQYIDIMMQNSSQSSDSQSYNSHVRKIWYEEYQTISLLKSEMQKYQINSFNIESLKQFFSESQISGNSENLDIILQKSSQALNNNNSRPSVSSISRDGSSPSHQRLLSEDIARETIL